MDFNGLEELLPEQAIVKVKGEDIVIKPFKFKSLLTVLKLVYKIFSSLDLEDELDEMSIIRTIVTESDSALEIMSIAIKKPLDYFDDIDADEGLELATTIFKINKDFFTQKLAPKLKSLQSPPSNSPSAPIVEAPPEVTAEEALESLLTLEKPVVAS